MSSKNHEITLLDYWMILYLRKGALIAVTLLAVFSAGLFSYFKEPIYEAKVVFFVPSKPDTLKFVSSNHTDQTVRKPLSPTVSKDEHAPYLGFFESDRILGVLSGRVGKHYDRLKGDVDFRLSNEFLLEAYSRDQDADRAARIANLLPEVFNNFLNEISKTQLEEKRQAIESEIASTTNKLIEAENDLRAFQKKRKIAAIAKEIDDLEDQKREFQQEFERSEINLESVNSQIKNLEQALSKEAEIYVSSRLIWDRPVIVERQREISQLEATLAGKKVEFRDEHPDIHEIKARIEILKGEVERLVKEMVESQAKTPDSFHEELRKRLVYNMIENRSLSAKKTGLRMAIENLEKRILLLLDSKYNLDNLRDNVTIYRQSLNSLKLLFEEIRAQEKRPMQNVIVVSPAKAPQKPAYPVMWLNILVAGTLGLGTGIIYCFLLDYIERAKDPERVWGDT